MPAKIALNSGFATALVALLLGFVFAIETHAAEETAQAEVALERLTWTDVRDRLATGTDTVIVPTGGTEQNGRHMALGKHNYIVAETARRIATRLGNTLVAPVMAYVPEGDPSRKAGHMSLPGTLSVPEDVFEKVLEATAQSLKTHGFKRIVLLGDSGGNQRAQARVAKRLSDAWKSEGVQVIAAGDYYANNGGDSFLESKGLSARQIGTHAGVRDTSELLAVAPFAVDMNRAVADRDGATGDARLSRAEWGEQLLERKVAAAVAEIRRHAVAANIPVETSSLPAPLSWIANLFGG